MVYLITYDLNAEGQDYNLLYEKIKSLGEWFHPLESVWFLQPPSWILYLQMIFQQLYEMIWITMIAFLLLKFQVRIDRGGCPKLRGNG